MREIKFRIWYQEEKRMIYPLYTGDTFMFGGMYLEEIFQDNTIPYMQYTGCKDKDGVEIYESDWIKAKFSTGQIYVGEVVFRNGAFNLKEEKPLPRGLSYCTFTFLSDFEVIGNIYENPDLLK